MGRRTTTCGVSRHEAAPAPPLIRFRHLSAILGLLVSVGRSIFGYSSLRACARRS